MQEVLQLLSVMTGDHRFEETFSDDTRGGVKTMCEVLDRLEMRGRAEGLAEGRAEARSKGFAEGMNRILTLMQKLFAAGRVEDARKACFDRAYCNKLLTEFGIP